VGSSLNQKGLLGLVLVFVVLAVLSATGVLVAVNLSSSIPGDIIYPVKGIYENLRLAFNELNYESRAEVFIDLSNTRLNEFEKLVNRRNYSKIPQTLDDMVLMQKMALDNIGRAQNRGNDISEVLRKLALSINKQQSSLRKLYFEVSPEGYGVMDKAIESTQESLNRIGILKGRR